MQMFKCEEVKVLPNRSTKRAATRIYIWPKGETILENLMNRRDRPYTTYRKEVLPGVLAGLGIRYQDVKVRWSQYAGCTMCPCSPGFILDGYFENLTNKDVHVTLT
jgi:hypothetical protein